IILALMPFHAFLTVWLSSSLGHYTALRLWKEVILVLCGLGVACLLMMDAKIRAHTLFRRLIWLIVAYLGLLLLYAIGSLQSGSVEHKAAAYGTLLDSRFLLFFLITWAIALRTNRLEQQWQKIILIPAAIVIVFGLAQALVLPHDFLVHFGYGTDTIKAFDTVNQNSMFVRIQSTLRGSNPLGAYLVIPIAVVTTLLLRSGFSWRKAGFLAASLLALYFTYSRSAYLGAILAVLVVAIIAVRSKLGRRYVYGELAGLAVLAGLLGILVQHNGRVQNVLLHTSDSSTAVMSSNQGRTAGIEQGITDLETDPLGNGPGSAGPASFYNAPHNPRIAENYFLQIGQEIGIPGLIAFITINAGIGYLLWIRRDNNLALALLASLIGLSFINLLSHAWADDTLAYVWWGLAGIAVAQLPAVEVIKTKVVRGKKAKQIA
ncbi:O-antigen ligase family protein, partial [Candidatus Saccharibacteria bacterium]|nr:O-antigen ligase family protein [Candidatus Saccharibacteria bacterium]